MLYWIGLGSNLGDSIAHIGDALSLLGADRDIDLDKVSRFYRSKPWGHRHQPDFVNAVATLESSLPPLRLLERMKTIEQRLGRHRKGRRWGPRVIDLDMLLAGDLILHLERLVLPHPRMHRRRFVLEPLAEIDSSLVIPARGRVQRLLQGLPEDGTRPVTP